MELKDLFLCQNKSCGAINAPNHGGVFLETITLYTDGACSGNPGKGAWAFAIIDNQEVSFSEHGLNEMTTNNQMELTAIIKGLSHLLDNNGQGNTVTVHTDSSYCMNALKDWVHGWKKKGWKKADGKVIENLELIQTLYSLCYEKGLTVMWKKVKAHQKPSSKDYDPFNDFVDKLATKHL